MSSHSGSLNCYADEEAPANTATTSLQQTVSSDNQQTAVADPSVPPHTKAYGSADISDNSNADKLIAAGPENFTGNRIQTFVSDNDGDKYTPEQATHDAQNCDNRDLHDQITSLKASLATALRDSVGPLEREVKKLRQENVVLRWSNNNLVAAI
ncbi:hypothetical protein B0T18DRAFT_429796 [Schizothecium vesticola]|uniref:Uncharacterized protein n=1 Tax=Schizothecium vesticola TaxID=314040 RepID=A0AA40EWN6_9PEZI|nr:hypothetical protein B0T18DRAFT_429796 [Schizothecium vesticola]